MARKKQQGGGVAALLRDAGAKTKLAIEQKNNIGLEDVPELLIDEVTGRPKPVKPRIFNVLEYIESSWGLGMNLYPGQRFLVKLYYHMPLEDKEKTIKITDVFGEKVLYHFTEKEYLEFLYNEGRCNIKEQDHERRELILAIGRRGGKTTLSSIFASYEVYRLLNLNNPQKYYGLPNGNRIQIISVATDRDQAGLLFNEVTSHLAKCEYFKPFIANNTQSHIMFRTPYDIEKYGPNIRHQNGKFTSFNGKATLRVTFKGSTAKGLRGAGNCVVILDEVAHFHEKGTMSAEDIYKAVTPSTAAFAPKDPDDPEVPIGPVESRIIMISSPLGRSGKFYEQYHLAMTGGPGSENILAIQAPTWEVNPTVPTSYYKQHYHADPATFMVEHGAQFSDRVTAWIERDQDLLDCVDPDLKPQLIGRPRHPHEMGIDVGLVNDGTCVAITTVDKEGKIVLAYHEYWQAGIDWRESNPHLKSFTTNYCKTLKDVTRLDFDEIANWIETLTKKFFITEGFFDQWNGIPLEQALLKKGLTQFRTELFQRDLSSRIYQNAKLQMFDKRLKLYNTPILEGKKNSAFIDELLHLQANRVSKHLIVVEAPKTAGYHDDRSDAFARAVWLTSLRIRNQKHIYGAEAIRPTQATGMMTPGRYQRMRALRHGGYSPRTVPKNLGLRRR